jgi:hypothetical protein
MSSNWRSVCAGRKRREPDVDKGLVTLLGMSIAYVASLLGMCLAWWSWRKRHKNGGES